LFFVDLGEALAIWDLRPGAREPLTVLRGADRALYRACDAATDVGQLAGHLAASGVADAADSEAVEARLEPLVARGLLVREGSRYLAIAIPLGDYRPPAGAMKRFYQVARRLGRRRREGGIVVPLADSFRRQPSAARPARAGAARRSAPSRSMRRSRPLRVPQFTLSEQGELIVR
jgi:hypothetical protein